MSKLISFHGSQELKDKYVSRIKLHAAADEIIKGQYWEDGKGCAVGCTIHGSDHLKYETELGIPFDLALWEDRIFENLPNEEAKTFPLEFIESIPVGVGLEKIGLKLSLWLIEDEKIGFLTIMKGKKNLEFFGRLSEILKKEIADTATDADREEFKKYAYAYASASAYASAYASASASASAYAYASASASAYASAYAIIRTKLIELLRTAQ